MSTSIYKKFINYAGVDQSPRDPLDVWTAQTIINNNMHRADVSGQVMAAWAASSDLLNGITVIGSAVEGETLVNTIEDGVLHPIAVFGPFSCRLGVDGSAFPMRARIGTKTEGTGTFRYRLVVSHLPDLTLEMGANGNNVLEATTANTTSTQWLGDGLLTFSEDETNRAISDRPTPPLLGSANVDTAKVVELYAGVYVNIPTNLSIAHLQGLYLAEWVGT